MGGHSDELHEQATNRITVEPGNRPSDETYETNETNEDPSR